MYNFNAEQESKNVIKWIKDWFENDSGGAKGILLGISGGLDSTFVGKLCCEAIGKEKVLGLLMPNGDQKDLNDAVDVCKHLGIVYRIINIKNIYNEILRTSDYSKQTKTNIAPCIRLTICKAEAQELGLRIAGTLNASERFVGWTTKFADQGDINPILKFTKTEIISMSRHMGIPEKHIIKPAEDGLSGITDEEAFGFTYEVLDKYIRTGLCDNILIQNKIDHMHIKNLHKYANINYEPYTIYT